MDLESVFSDEEKQALAILAARGLQVFANAQIEDVRDVDTGAWTFRYQDRYDLVLAIKKTEAPARDQPVEPGTKAPDKMTVKELRAEARTIPGETGVSGMGKDQLIEVVARRRKYLELLLKRF